jgi:nucleoside 2-deoxyribosyltransferase
VKIYLGFTVLGDREKLEIAKHLAMLLQARGHRVLTTHLLSRNARDEEAIHPPEFVFERDMRWIKEADAIVAEVTNKSFGVAFEIGYAAANNKKVYILYDESLKETISKMATGNTMKNVVRVSYNSLHDINGFVEKYF